MSIRSITNIINQWDPIDLLAMGAPDDEYESEIYAIFQILPHVDDVYRLNQKVIDIFTEAFGESFEKNVEDCLIISQQLLRGKSVLIPVEGAYLIQNVEEAIQFLSEKERIPLLKLPVSALLSSLDQVGFPRLTSHYFLWKSNVFYMVCREKDKCIEDIQRENHIMLSIQIEDKVMQNYSQVVAEGNALITREKIESITKKILEKYLPEEHTSKLINSLLERPHVIVVLKPEGYRAIKVTKCL